MQNYIHISIDTYINKKIVLKLYNQKINTLVILFSGNFYTKLASLIFYSNNIARKFSYNTLVIEYPF